MIIIGVLPKSVGSAGDVPKRPTILSLVLRLTQKVCCGRRRENCRS